jgi:hypothetical protein
MNLQRGRSRPRLGRLCRRWSKRHADRVTTCNRRTDRPDRGPASGSSCWVRANDIVGVRDQPSAVARHDPIMNCCHGHSPNVSRWVGAAGLHLFQATEDPSVLNATVPIYRRKCPKLVALRELSNFDQRVAQHRSKLASAPALPSLHRGGHGQNKELAAFRGRLFGVGLKARRPQPKAELRDRCTFLGRNCRHHRPVCSRWTWLSRGRPQAEA